MKNHIIVQRICLLTSIICLSFPYLLAGHWPIMLIFMVMAAFWRFIKERSVFWSSSVLLMVFVFIAVAGVMAEFSTLLMAVACTAALAWWDLANFEQNIVVSQPLETLFLLERYHLQSLAIAVSGGLILVFVGSFLNLQIPFIGTVLLVSLAIGCLTHALQSLEKKNV